VATPAGARAPYESAAIAARSASAARCARSAATRSIAAALCCAWAAGLTRGGESISSAKFPDEVFVKV
jgi:hypothetical protein